MTHAAHTTQRVDRELDQPATAEGQKAQSKTDTYDARFFGNVTEEDAFIVQQILLVGEPPITYYTEGQWVALKLDLSVEEAQAKIARAQTRRKEHGTQEG